MELGYNGWHKCSSSGLTFSELRFGDSVLQLGFLRPFLFSGKLSKWFRNLFLEYLRRSR